MDFLVGQHTQSVMVVLKGTGMALARLTLAVRLGPPLQLVSLECQGEYYSTVGVINYSCQNLC